MEKSRSHWSIRRSKDGQFYFCFVAGNGKVVVTSETYTQKHNALDGVKVIAKSCKSYSIQIKDETI